MPKNWKWRESKDVIARLVTAEDLKGIRSKDVIIDPKEAAVLIREGKIEDTITQTKVRKVGAGLFKRLQNFLFGSKDVEILFVDTRPIDVTGRIKNTATKDKVKQEGKCTLRFQINLNDAPKVLNLMKGRDRLTVEDLRDKISDEITATVFSPYISKYTADEFRGSTEVQDAIEESVKVDLRKTLDLWGLNLVSLHSKWDIGPQERVERKEKKAELEEREKDIQAERAKSDISREYDVKGHKEEEQYEQRDQHIEHKQDLDWKETKYDRKKDITGVEHKEEKKDVRTDHSLSREDKQHQQKMKEEGREWEQDKKEVEKALEWKDKLDQQRMEKEEHKTEQEIKRFQGIDLKGKKVEADVEKTKAEMEAEKAKHNLETYQEAQEKEREHQKEMTGQMAKMMSAAKQDTPDTLVEGADSTSANINARSNSDGFDDECDNCGTEVKSGWDHCPECGEEL